MDDLFSASFVVMNYLGLNQTVERNLQPFPDDFMFQLVAEEFASLRFQSGTSNLRSQIVTLNEKPAGRDLMSR